MSEKQHSVLGTALYYYRYIGLCGISHNGNKTNTKEEVRWVDKLDNFECGATYSDIFTFSGVILLEFLH